MKKRIITVVGKDSVGTHRTDRSYHPLRTVPADR